MKLVDLFRPLPRLALIVGLGLAASGCALPPRDPAALAAYRETNDPLEGVNRMVFGANEMADVVLIRPAAEIYGVAPSFLRDRVRDFVRNLSMPLVLVNELLQGDMKGAEDATARILANTTLGLGGLFDIAALNGLEYKPEDFGQTLAVWGVPEGPYLVLPLLGPSNLRDAVGRGAESFADPVGLYAKERDFSDAMFAVTGVGGIDLRQRLIPEIDDLRRNSLDYYAALRSSYRQYRQGLINEGKKSPSYELYD